MSRFKRRLTGVFLSLFILSSCDGAPKRVEGEIPFEPGSLMNMADSFLEAGDFSSALRLYQRTARENANHVPSRLGLAMIYNKLGASDMAISFYQQVLIIDPDNAQAKHGLARSLLSKNRPEEALVYLQEISRKNPANHKIYNSLGLAHDLMGLSEKAQMQYGLGLNIKPDDISLLNNLALSFALEGQYAPSIRLLSKAINLDYSVTKAQQNLVMVYVMSGEENTARKIGAGLMNDEELENNIKHYKWLLTLSAKQRAQAIYLGIKSFAPEKNIDITVTNSDGSSDESLQQDVAKGDVVTQSVPMDPKKKQLMDILTSEKKQEEQDFDKAVASPQQVEHDSVEDTKVSAEAEPEILQALIKSNTRKLSDEKIYLVQLGSFPTEALALIGWQKISRKSEGLLANFSPLTRQVILKNGAPVIRLFIREIEQYTVANSTCQSLKDQGGDCLVLKTGRE